MKIIHNPEEFDAAASVVALGMILWLAILLIKDPKGVVKASLKKKAEKQ